MSKTFTQAPKPRSLSDEAIVAFERGGAGQDTRSHKHTLPQSPISVIAQTEIPAPAPIASQPETEEGRVPMRRLSVDLPESLHRRFKTACSRTDRKMLVEVTEFVRRRVEELEGVQ